MFLHLLLFGVLSATSALDSCTVLVVKSQEIYSVIYNTTTGCCDNWCTYHCNMTTSYITSEIVYYQTTECCPGHGGENCYPECNKGCLSNQECSAPDTCTCLAGWIGEKCQRVDGLQATEIMSNSITLSWITPKNDNVNGYYIVITSNEHSLNMTTASGINSTTIMELYPFTSYRCCVIPMLYEGNGTENCVASTTREGVPSTPPNAVISSSLSSSAILLQWQPPLLPNGIINHYTLYINYTNSSGISTRAVDEQYTLYLLDGLSVNQEVGVSISSTTGGGEGPHSSYVFSTTKGMTSNITSVTPTVPGSFTVATTSSDLITDIVWVPPKVGGSPVLFYHLTIESLGIHTEQFKWTLRAAQTLNTTLSLDPFIPYEMRVMVGTESGAYGLLNSYTFFSKEGVPIVFPANLNVSRNSASSLYVSWSPLTLRDSRGIITSYTIIYSETANSCDSSYNQLSLNTTNTSIILEELSIQKLYCVSVAASTMAGTGSISDQILIPLYENSQFSMQLIGVSNCDEWLLLDPKLKASDIVDILVEVLNDDCSCHITSEHFVMWRFKCIDSYPNTVTFVGHVIGTQSTGSVELVEMLQRWVNRAPDVVVQSVTLRTIDEDICVSDSSTEEMNFTELLLSIALALVSLLWIITLSLCVLTVYIKFDRKKSKDIQLTSSTYTYSTDTNLSEYTCTSSDRDSPQINKKDDDDSGTGTMV